MAGTRCELKEDEKDKVGEGTRSQREVCIAVKRKISQSRNFLCISG